MASNIVEIIKFKQEINELIDKCLNTDKYDLNEKTNKRLLVQLMIYFNRMQSVYSIHQSSDDEDDFISDDEDENEDYTKIMEGRIYSNTIVTNYNEQEHNIRSRILGINGFTEDYNESSSDPVIYQDEQTEPNGSSEDESDGDFSVNNFKKSMALFNGLDEIEIISTEEEVNYADPSIE